MILKLYESHEYSSLLLSVFVFATFSQDVPSLYISSLLLFILGIMRHFQSVHKSSFSHEPTKNISSISLHIRNNRLFSSAKSLHV